MLEDDDGVRLPPGTSRRIACDAAAVVMRHAHDGTVLDVGRKTRTIPPAIRRALAARDRRCRFPGCEARHCDAHHVRHWAMAVLHPGPANAPPHEAGDVPAGTSEIPPRGPMDVMH